jgi:uncharacterized membrane protein YjfL (UPF0719 family)
MNLNTEILNTFNNLVLISVELVIGFGLFWLGQFFYQKGFRRMALNEELFIRDNAAVAIALVGFYLGIVIALGGALDKSFVSWQAQLLTLILYGLMAIVLMLLGAWIGDRWILRRLDCARETLEERNFGAAVVEAANHIANGLILNTALGGDSGSWWVALVCWAIGLGVLVLASFVYPRIARYDVFGEIRKRNNPAAGVALAGFLIAIGNLIRSAFSPEFENWTTSLSQYGSMLIVGTIALIFIRWFADLILVPGVKISDEIVRQNVPNLGAGIIEAFAYIAASCLIQWMIMI